MKMTNWHYSAYDIYNATEQLGLEVGDVLFIHSNIGFFGRCAAVKDPDQLCKIFYMALRQQIGPEGTICVPTFTYSYPSGVAYDAQEPTKMGVFSEWVRTHPLAYRSLDPCYSVAAIGADAKKLCKGVSQNSFDDGSFFARFERKQGKILNLNFDAKISGSFYVQEASYPCGGRYRNYPSLADTHTLLRPFTSPECHHKILYRRYLICHDYRNTDITPDDNLVQRNLNEWG